MQAADDYQQRLSRLCPTEVVLVRSGESASEARGLLRAAQKADVVIALDEHGKQRTTEQYAQYFAPHRTQSTTFCYLVGGADGFAPEVLAQVRERWSLSAMTLPPPRRCRALVGAALPSSFVAHRRRLSSRRAHTLAFCQVSKD